jgi:hypothetical protein
MWLISILFLHSNSFKGLGGFVTFNEDHKITLSYKAKRLLADPSFVILTSGTTGSDTDLITNTLVRGMVPIQNSDEFPTEDTFRFHYKIPLTDFCEEWAIECGPDPPNLDLLFIDAGGDGSADQDIHRGILALTPIVSFRIHVTPGESSQSCLSLLKGAALTRFMRGTGDGEAVAIFVPQPTIPGLINDSVILGSEEARNARDANLTKWLDGHCGGYTYWVKFAGVFGQSGSLSLELVRDIARLIVRRARGRPPLPETDALGLFEEASEWMRGRDSVSDLFPLVGFLKHRAMKRLISLENSVIAAYREETLVRLAEGYQQFTRNSRQESKAIAEKAVEEFGRRVETFPALLRKYIEPYQIEIGGMHVRDTLREQLPNLVALQRLELQQKMESENSEWKKLALLLGLV